MNHNGNDDARFFHRIQKKFNPNEHEHRDKRETTTHKQTHPETPRHQHTYTQTLIQNYGR